MAGVDPGDAAQPVDTTLTDLDVVLEVPLVVKNR